MAGQQRERRDDPRPQDRTSRNRRFGATGTTAKAKQTPMQ